MEKSEKHALLHKYPPHKSEKNSLRLLILDNETEIKKLGNIEVLGHIKFKDVRDTMEIVRDFSNKYFGGSGIETYVKPLSSFSFIDYPSSYELVITNAFVNYFSKFPS